MLFRTSGRYSTNIFMCLCLMLIALADRTAFATYDVPITIDVVKLSNLTPNPALVGFGSTMQVACYPHDNYMEAEAFAVGCSITWSYTLKYSSDGTTYSDATPTQQAQAHISTAAVTGSQTRFNVTMSFDVAGYWRVALHGTLVYTYYDNKVYGGVGDCNVDVTASEVLVTISPSIIKTGYKADEFSPSILTHVTAIVSGNAAVASHVHFGISGEDRATISNVVANDTSNTISFDVAGNSFTPPTQHNGDTTIVASSDDATAPCGYAQVVVLVPSAIGTPHQNPNPQNYTPSVFYLCGNGDSAPSFPTVPDGQFAQVTFYGNAFPIHVLDQFGDQLDSMYDGSWVTEDGVRLNVTVSGGTYYDFLGFATFGGAVADTADNRNAWLTGPHAPFTPFARQDLDVSLGVEVGGHTLSPAIAHRSHELLLSPFRHTVTWP